MTRKKLDYGGDGVATIVTRLTEPALTNSFVMQTLSNVMIPRAESPSMIQLLPHHSCSALLRKRPLDIPKGGAFVVYRRKKAERVKFVVLDV